MTGLVVTVYVDNHIDGRTQMDGDEIAAAYWASKFADLDEYPWPRERSFGLFLASPRIRGGLSVVIDPADGGVTQNELLDWVLDREPGASA